MAKMLEQKGGRNLISVVVLTYDKRLKTLFRCLKSIYNSTYKKREVILVVNGNSSFPRSGVLSKFPRIRIIRLPKNTGIFFGFNTGFANALGKYIVALDDDTAIKPDTLEKFAKNFEKFGERTAVLSPNAYNPITKHHYKPPSSKNMISFHGSCAFRKKCLEKAGGYDNDFFRSVGADDLAIRIVNLGYEIHFAQDVVIDHFENTSKLRKKQIFYTARNRAWLNIKHFSIEFIPALILRDLVWIGLLPYRRKSAKALYYGLLGYILGYASFPTPLRKRRVVSKKIQKRFLKNYLFGDIIKREIKPRN